MTALLLAMSVPIYRKVYVVLSRTDVCLVEAKSAAHADERAKTLLVDSVDADTWAAAKSRAFRSQSVSVVATLPKAMVGAGYIEPTYEAVQAAKGEPYADPSRFVLPFKAASVPILSDPDPKHVPGLYLCYIVSAEPHAVWVLAKSASEGIKAAQKEWAQEALSGQPADWSRFEAGSVYPEGAFHASLRRGFEYVVAKP